MVKNKNLIINADCLTALKELPENSVDSIVTDPPYGLSFMGKKWDYDVPGVEIWKECLRVLKPGAFLLSFAGTRTYHRMAVNIEDAGFEIRDMISWLYGSGFPKSYNIGKGINKTLKTGNASWNGTADPNNKPLGYSKLQHQQGYRPNDYSGNNKTNTNEELSEEAKQWEGWGTALKPACEPIVVARKPISEKNIALNCLKWGTGGINIDGCRVGTEKLKEHKSGNIPNDRGEWGLKEGYVMPEREGRFPANIILDEEAGKILDEQSGISKSSIGKPRGTTKKGMFANSEFNKVGREHNDKGGASRFFYCAKASKSERNMGCEELDEKEQKITNQYEMPREDGSMREVPAPRKNNHPTVKPIKLMQYLVRLVTPKGGVCLDPFLGSGTTACACVKEGMNYIGVEREADYIKIAKARIKAYEDIIIID